MSTREDDNTQVRFISTVASAGAKRKIITVPAKFKAQLESLHGQDVIVTVQKIL